MLLYTGRDMEFFFHQGTSDFLLITFGELAYLADGKRYWGKDMVERNGITTIGITAKKPNWFPDYDIKRFFAYRQELLEQYKGRIVMVGHSMGGYGAIKYSGLFDAATVIATSPQYTIDRSILAGGLSRAPNPYYDPGLHFDMHPKPHDIAGKLFIFFDIGHPERDRSHFEEYDKLRYKRKHMFHFPYAGHDIPRALTVGEDFLELINLCRTGTSKQIRSHIRKARIKSRVRVCTIAVRAAVRHPDVAIRIFEKYQDSFNPVYKMILARMLPPSHKDKAASIAREIVENRPDLKALPPLAALLASQGRMEEAEMVAQATPDL